MHRAPAKGPGPSPNRTSLPARLAPLVFCLCLAGCNRSQPAHSEAAPDRELVSKTAGAAAPQQPASDHRAVAAEFSNVMFHLTPAAAAHLETVRGELWPTGKYDMPLFDDRASFEVHVANGTISIAPDALAEVMNEYVFARHDAPMKDVSIKIKEDRLVIKGKLHSKGDLPFETGGELSVTSDGRLRLHSEKVKALHVPVKTVMSVIGIELASVINTSKVPGMDTDKNDLILDLGTLLPPPHIRGKIAAARLGRNAITVVYGDGGKPAANPAVSRGQKRDGPPGGNYMAFRGNRVRFGKLTMENADLTVIDLDAADPLDWDQDSYQDQLVAGYCKATGEFGLRVYVKDFSKLPRSSRSAKPEKAENQGH